MRIKSTIATIQSELEKVGTRRRAEGEKKYLKSDLDFLGATVPQIRKLSRDWLRQQQEDIGREDLLRLTQALWRRRVHELRMFAIVSLQARVDGLQARDVRTLEELLRDSHTWAYVDNLVVPVVGPLVERYPSLGRTLDRWARDPDFWIRRSALLALLLPLRRGGGDWPRFVRYADSMLAEKEFSIRKAIGWVLRETGKQTPERVFEYLSTRIDRVSGLTLREGAKRLPEADRGRLLAAYRAR